jgi:ADP-ribosyl-[dinitrogen reductase] hydrolase
MTDPARLERATGALVGSVVGDALGAPFEFGPAGQFSETFRHRVLLGRGEMIGGGPWERAEWTDDTQMGLLVAQSLLESNGLDEADLFARFQAWVDGLPKDVGIQTRSVLTSGQAWDEAAADHFESGQPAAGNGSLMRATAGALFFAGAGRDATMDAARRISALTHGDPAAGEGCAIFHELVRLALEGEDPLDHLNEALDLVPPAQQEQWAARLDPDYEPALDRVPNGAVWPALGAALWALRTSDSFEGALVTAIDLGGDTDTVACITGGLAGAHYGIGAIPSRWTTHLHGHLIGGTDSGLHLDDLEQLARDLLAGGMGVASAPPPEHAVEPTLVFETDRIYAASFPGVAAAAAGGRLPDDAVVISLSRTFGQLDAHSDRNQVWLLDQDGPGSNLSIDLVLDDVIDTMRAVHDAGRPIVVHCHGGRSRTGLILRAWALTRDPTMTVAAATDEVAGRWPHLDTWNRSFDRALGAWAVRRRTDSRSWPH